MRDQIIRAICSAKDNYINRVKRPGFPSLRAEMAVKIISSKKIIFLIQQLEHSKNNLDAFNILTDFLTQPDIDWSDYGFNSYLLDALQTESQSPNSELNAIEWGCFTPKAIKLFQGSVYRGTSSPPEKIFEQGFNDYHPSSRVKDYLNPRNLNVGISTSRSFAVAEEYTRVTSRQDKRRFVYTIIYLGSDGIDIIETAKARGLRLKSMNNVELARAVEKDEINIVNQIPREYIYCVTEFLLNGQQKVTYNPKFNANHQMEKSNFIRDTQEELNIGQRVAQFFANIWSGLKSYIWLLRRYSTIDNYGITYRAKEIKRTPIMQEAESIYNQFKIKKNQYCSMMKSLRCHFPGVSQDTHVISQSFSPTISPANQTSPIDAEQSYGFSDDQYHLEQGLRF
jgi:hypothetical protein